MVTIRGEAALKASLRRVAAGPSVREHDAICADALEPLRAEVATSAPRPSLRSTVVVRKRQSRGRTGATFWVSFVGMGRRVAHLIEFGTQPHSLKKGASVRKGIFIGQPPMHKGDAPEPFFRPAYEAKKIEVIQRYAASVWNLLLSTVRRTGGRR